MVLTINEIKKRIAPIAKKHEISTIYLFGSYARGEATDDSDVDILIDRAGSKIRGMFDMGGLYEELTSSLGKEIDLVTTQTLEQPDTRVHCQIFIENLEKKKRYKSMGNRL